MEGKVASSFYGQMAELVGPSAMPCQAPPNPADEERPSPVKRTSLATVISKFREVTGKTLLPCSEPNPITKYFDIGEQVGNAGPCRIWCIYNGVRKSDKMEVSIFIMEKRLTDRLLRAKKSEALLVRVRNSIEALDTHRGPRILKVIHRLEEGPNTLAFASEPVMCSLANILDHYDSSPLGNAEEQPINPIPWSNSSAYPPSPHYMPSTRAPFAKEYTFADIEIRCGFQQMVDALLYYHNKSRRVHRNVSPENILVSKSTRWKLFGLDFIESLVNESAKGPIWSVKLPKLSQPNLDFLAPETQTTGRTTVESDMYSLAMVMIAVINKGRPIVQADNNPQLYIKQMRHLESQSRKVIARGPQNLREHLIRMVLREETEKPYQVYKAEPAVNAIQTLEDLSMMDPFLKSWFFRTTLLNLLPEIPARIRWATLWPNLVHELFNENTPYLFKSVLYFIKEATEDEYDTYLHPMFMEYLKGHKPAMAISLLLQNLEVFLKKAPDYYGEEYLLPYVISTLDNLNCTVQVAGLKCLIENHSKYDDKQLVQDILPKTQRILESNAGEMELLNHVLEFYEVLVTRMTSQQIVDLLLPTLLCMRLTEAKLVLRVVKLYRNLVQDKKLCLSVSVMATKLIPSIAPHTVNPTMSVEQFVHIMEILYDMLDCIDYHQRKTLKMAISLSVSERYRVMRKMSTDLSDPPPFDIPNFRFDSRRTTSADEVARRISQSSLRPGPVPYGAASAGVLPRGSIGRITPRIETTSPESTGAFSGAAFKSTVNKWFYGFHTTAATTTATTTTTTTTTATSQENNLLRVCTSVAPNRRLSDNTLTTPKIRIAPSCASSPGGTPGGSTANLPARRHSSIGPQERRGSAVSTTLSPPPAHQPRGKGGSGSSLSVPATSHCAGGSMPNTSSSVPFLTSSMNSMRSRRPSTTAGSARGSGLLQQISSGVVRHLPVGSQFTPPRLPNWTTAGYNALTQQAAMAVRKCPSLNITLSK